MLIAVAATQQAVGQSDDQETKSFQMVRTAVAPVIDGVLEEDIWLQATMVDDLYQMDPIEFSDATRTWPSLKPATQGEPGKKHCTSKSNSPFCSEKLAR